MGFFFFLKTQNPKNYHQTRPEDPNSQTQIKNFKQILISTKTSTKSHILYWSQRKFALHTKSGNSSNNHSKATYNPIQKQHHIWKRFSFKRLVLKFSWMSCLKSPSITMYHVWNWSWNSAKYWNYLFVYLIDRTFNRSSGSKASHIIHW